MAERQDNKQELHIDQDWKAEARAEKERLSREQRQKDAADKANERKRAEGVLGGDAAEGDEEHGPLPPADFAMLANSLATQALMFMSPHADPETGRSLKNLDLAKHTIDLLGVLEEKTQGNLTSDEKSLLDRVLYQTRMAYVSATRTL
ncbi:MAG TPA: DUF1844 domain-containing protein [Phycisphaerae bacterium]|nr:DUF1844 domain-containing protein [Phycisphaerae bacterium]HOI56137.1 DUF1844 domain-containing protein [Phycisphaerae bacterium]